MRDEPSTISLSPPQNAQPVEDATGVAGSISGRARTSGSFTAPDGQEDTIPDLGANLISHLTSGMRSLESWFIELKP